MRFAPALGLLLHVLLKLDPAGTLLPAHFMVLLHNQLVQLHKQLEMKRSRRVRKNNNTAPMQMDLHQADPLFDSFL